MGIFDFPKDAGTSILGPGDEQKAAAAAADARGSARGQAAYERVLAELNERVDARLTRLAADHGFDTARFLVAFDVVQGRVTLTGTVASQSDCEKLVLLVGNHQGVAQVEDRLSSDVETPRTRFYTVVKGDTLSKIARTRHGDPLLYSAIFEANRPLLKDPDLIYPGQVLRLPVHP